MSGPFWSRAVCTGLLLVTVTAHADVPKAKARELFEEGVSLMQAGRFAEAGERLRASLAGAPRAPTAFNLAIALRGTGDVLGALDLFQRLESREFGPVGVAEKSQVAALRTECEAEVAHLTVQLPATHGSDVRVDGVALALQGETTTVRVNPGIHHVTLTAPDIESSDIEVKLARGERRSVVLEPRARVDRRSGTLQLETSDARAWLSVEGHGGGSSPLVRQLPPGTYRVSVRLGDNVRNTALSLPAGRTVRLFLDLPKGRPFYASPWFWLAAGAGAVAAGATTVILATRTTERPAQVNDVWGAVSALEF